MCCYSVLKLTYNGFGDPLSFDDLTNNFACDVDPFLQCILGTLENNTLAEFLKALFSTIYHYEYKNSDLITIQENT